MEGWVRPTEVEKEKGQGEGQHPFRFLVRANASEVENAFWGLGNRAQTVPVRPRQIHRPLSRSPRQCEESAKPAKVLLQFQTCGLRQTRARNWLGNGRNMG